MELLVRDVARLLQVSEKTIYRWLAKGKIPAYRLNEQYRFNRAELLEWAVARKLNAPVELLEAEPASSVPSASLADSLEAGGIFYRVGGRNRDEALREAVKLLRLPPLVDRNQVYQVLLAREEMGSTAIGGGFAIPHSRHPVIPNLDASLVTICFLDHPIHYAALDGQPVHTLFTLISPRLREHLYLLSRIVFALRDDALRRALVDQAGRAEIMNEFRRVEPLFGVPVVAHV